MMTVETSGLLRPAHVDENRYAKFLAKQAAYYRRCRDKHNAAGKGMYHGWTDAECQGAADFYCGCYRHHFRVLVPVASPIAG